MAMSPEESGQLGALTQSIKHLEQRMDEIKDLLSNMVTTTHLEAKMAPIIWRLDQVEQKQKEQSPRSMLRTLTEVCVGITALAAAAGVVALLVKGKP